MPAAHQHTCTSAMPHTCALAAASSSSFPACLAARATSDSTSAADTPSPAAAAAAAAAPCRPASRSWACCCSVAAALGLLASAACTRSLPLAASARTWLLVGASGPAAAKMLSRMSARQACNRNAQAAVRTVQEPSSRFSSHPVVETVSVPRHAACRSSPAPLHRRTTLPAVQHALIPFTRAYCAA